MPSVFDFVTRWEGTDKWMRDVSALKVRFRKPFTKKLAEKVRDIYVEAVKSNFSQQGRRYGGWAPLSVAYAAWKSRVAPGKPLLVLGGRMKRETTTPNEGSFHFSHTPTKVVTGSDNALVPYHQKGTRRMPARPLFVMTQDVANDVAKTLRDEIFRSLGLTRV